MADNKVNTDENEALSLAKKQAEKANFTSKMSIWFEIVMICAFFMLVGIVSKTTNDYIELKCSVDQLRSLVFRLSKLALAQNSLEGVRDELSHLEQTHALVFND